MYQLVGNGRFQLEINDFPCWVEANGAVSPHGGELAPIYPWLPPSARTRSVAHSEWNIDHPLRVLIHSGVPIIGRVTPEQLDNLNARLKNYKEGPVAGIVGLIRKLMPGAPTNPLQGFAQIVAPLPFDLAYDAENGLSVVAPEVAFQNGIVASIFYKRGKPERHELNLANSRPTIEGYLRRWNGALKWPPSAETADVELLYNDKEVDSLSVMVRPSLTLNETATSAAVDKTGGGISMDKRSDWEQVGDPLGEGGQSRVLLVRSPARSQERTAAIRNIRDKIPWHIATTEDAAQKVGQFATAVWDYARPDGPAELGAMKIFEKVRHAGAEGEQQALGRLMIEIKVLRQARPGLPKLLAANEAEKWIVTEYFPRGTIEDHIDTFKGKPAMALRAFLSLVSTLAPLHDEKIVHRDIKPANVFLRETNELVLGDFGIAFLPNQPDRLTLTNERVGPPDYMPPWAHRDQRFESVEPSFDVYMLGKLLWCMVAGRLRLFREEHHSPEFDLTEIFPNDPDMHVINSILDLCVVFDPSKCRQSAGELLPHVEKALSMLNRGGQSLAEVVPRPCRICGIGYYRPGDVGSSLDREIKLRAWRGQDTFMLPPLQVFTCDSCGHVELFIPRNH